MKEKMLSRNPYSAILNGENIYHLNCPKNISVRNWKKGLKNRWNKRPVEIIFHTNRIRRLDDWIKRQKIEYCRHPKFRDRYIVPGASKAIWLKINWSIYNERRD